MSPSDHGSTIIPSMRVAEAVHGAVSSGASERDVLMGDAATSLVQLYMGNGQFVEAADLLVQQLDVLGRQDPQSAIVFAQFQMATDSIIEQGMREDKPQYVHEGLKCLDVQKAYVSSEDERAAIDAQMQALRDFEEEGAVAVEKLHSSEPEVQEQPLSGLRDRLGL